MGDIKTCFHSGYYEITYISTVYIHSKIHLQHKSYIKLTQKPTPSVSLSRNTFIKRKEEIMEIDNTISMCGKETPSKQHHYCQSYIIYTK